MTIGLDSREVIRKVKDALHGFPDKEVDKIASALSKIIVENNKKIEEDLFPERKPTTHGREAHQIISPDNPQKS